MDRVKYLDETCNREGIPSAVSMPDRITREVRPGTGCRKAEIFLRV